MSYVKVKDLPAEIRGALRAIEYFRADIEISQAETFHSHVLSGDGSRGFICMVNLETGDFKVEYGDWGGANIFNANLLDQHGENITIPSNVAVIKGTKGVHVFARIILRPDNIAPLLGEKKAELSDRDRWILYTFDALTSAGRKNEWGRERDKPSEEDLNRLAGLGFLARSKNGATKITTDGKNLLNRRPGETIYHPKSK